MLNIKSSDAFVSEVKFFLHNDGMSSELWQRIRAARVWAKKSQQDIADACGASRSAIAQWEAKDWSKRTKPKYENLAILSKLTGAPLDWLLSDTSDLSPEWASKVDEEDPTPTSEAREDGSKYLQKPVLSCIRIPALNVVGSMGPGRMAPSQEEVIEEFAVSPAWLRKHTNISHPENLAIITGYGDSMAGTFSDGDLLLVDRGVTEVKIDAVYVLARGEELFIKRLQRVPDGTLLMISDNELYKPYPITPSELPTFHVLGRVIMAMAKKIL